MEQHRFTGSNYFVTGVTKMKVKKEITTFSQLYEQSWSGARDVLDMIVQAGKEEEVFNYLEDFLVDTYEDGLTETELNDLIWFDLFDLLTEAGISLDQD